jgi:hypothetical protein
LKLTWAGATIVPVGKGAAAAAGQASCGLWVGGRLECFSSQNTKHQGSNTTKSEFECRKNKNKRRDKIEL